MTKDEFSIELHKPNGEVEIVTYKKNKEKITGDYTIIRAYSKNPKEKNVTWRGVIDKNFNTIINFKPWKKIELLASNQLITQEEIYVNGSFKKYTCHIDLNKRKALSLFKDYKKISQRKIIIETLNEEEIPSYALYDICSGKIISNLFSQITPTNNGENEQIFLARKTITSPQKTLTKDFYCYIDIDGNIISPTYDNITNKYIYITKEQLPVWIQKEEEELSEYPQKKDIPEKLKEKIRKMNHNN